MTALLPIAVSDIVNPAWSALAGPHASIAERVGDAARYPADVSPFHAIADADDPSSWRDLAALVGPGGAATLVGVDTFPPGWDVVMSLPGVQMMGNDVVGAVEPQAAELGPADVPEILDLVARTEPGPFRARTVMLGRYVGIRNNGALVAMAGVRLHPVGATEISAVCTDPAHRGLGLARRLVLDVAADVRARGDVPFLHAAATNTAAISLYRSLGFAAPRPITFCTVRAPGGSS